MATLKPGSYVPTPNANDRERANARGYAHDILAEMYANDREAQEATDRFLDSGHVIGLRYRTPMADSYAEYRVVSARPFTVQHVAVMDAWHAPAPLIRGLRLSDITDRIRR